MSTLKPIRPQPAARSAPRKKSGVANPMAAVNEAMTAEIEARAAGRKGRSGVATKPKPKTREGKRGVVLYVDPSIADALRKLAVNNNSDTQRMGLRALELLFAEYGMSLPVTGDAPGTKA